MLKSATACLRYLIALLSVCGVLSAAQNDGRSYGTKGITHQRFSAAAASPLTDGSSKLIAPELPQVDLAGLRPETRKQVEQAYAAARKRPSDADAVGKLGMLLDLYHRSDDAALCYQRAHSIQPTAFNWLYYWGSLLLKERKAEQALPVLTAALELQPGYLPARLKLGETLLEAAKVEEANQIYEGILKDHPDAAEAFYGLGRVHAARGEQGAAAENYQKACELFPTYGAAHYGLAVAYRKLGRIAEAKEQADIHERYPYIVPPVPDPLRDELRSLDMSAENLLERGVQLEQVGRVDDAIAETEKALELDPALVKARVNLLILYARTGNAQKAEEQYKAVLASNPDEFPDAYYNYGVLLVNEGRFEEAEKAFRKTLAIAPTNDAAHNNLGYLLEREGKLTEAAAEYRKAIEIRPTSREAHFKLGRILVSQKQYQEGIEQLLQTLTPADENTPAYLYALGATYGRAGDSVEAVRYMEEAKEQAVARGQTALVLEIERDLAQVKGSSTLPQSKLR